MGRECGEELCVSAPMALQYKKIAIYTKEKTSYGNYLTIKLFCVHNERSDFFCVNYNGHPIIETAHKANLFECGERQMPFCFF